jgi:predicted dithiol-disulfide oxidoreductase (DUF899 family)
MPDIMHLINRLRDDLTETRRRLPMVKVERELLGNRCRRLLSTLTGCIDLGVRTTA